MRAHQLVDHPLVHAGGREVRTERVPEGVVASEDVPLRPLTVREGRSGLAVVEQNGPTGLRAEALIAPLRKAGDGLYTPSAWRPSTLSSRTGPSVRTRRTQN